MVAEQALCAGAQTAYAAPEGFPFVMDNAMRSRMPQPVGTLFRVVYARDKKLPVFVKGQPLQISTRYGNNLFRF